MSQLLQIRDTFSQWIDLIASTVSTLVEKLGTQRQVTLVEDETGGFVLRSASTTLEDYRIEITDGAVSAPPPHDWMDALRGSRAEIILRPSRLLFRPLELPKRATEFLDAIVRSQIDRLTPWTATESIYGWTAPDPGPGERIKLTIAATSRAFIAPLLRTTAELGLGTVVISTALPNMPESRIKLFEQRAEAVLNTARIRLVLLVLLLFTGISAVTATGISTVVGGSLADERQEIARKIAQRRALLRTGQDAAGGPERMLESRKRETPASVTVLEEISRLLPDHTYLTEMRIEGDKIQLVGTTQDAPSLISLIEQSAHFTRATFFAPTTRSANDPGERFHIEARIKPYFPAGT